MRVLLFTSVLLLAPLAGAQSQDIYSMPPEVLEWAVTDGKPLDLDAASTLAAVEDVRGRISGQSVHDCVEGITMDVPNSYRVMGTPTQQMFLDKYKTVFSDLGLPSAIHEFPKGGPGIIDPPEALQGGANLIGVLPGIDTTRWIVIGGHYDTRELTLGGGALDNAAGICTALELARAMKGHVDDNGPLAASVVFVWYDGEEWGLYGAVAFAEDPSVAMELLKMPAGTAPTILVSQSYDMPGLNYPAKNMWIQYGDPTVIDEYAVLNLRTAPIHADVEWTCWSYGCYEELKDRADFAAVQRDNANFQFLVREISYDVLGLPPEYVWVYDDHYGRSDHIPLIARGAAGNRIQGSHDNEYPHYHQPTDSLPGLYLLTGGEAPLVAGFETAAEAGGLSAFYVAKTGGLGHYGDVLFFKETAPAPEDSSGDADDNPTPAPSGAVLLALLFVLAAFAALRRKP